MIFLIKKTIRKNDPDKTFVSEIFRFFKNEQAFQDYKSFELKECFKEERNASIFLDGDNLTFNMRDIIKEITVLNTFSSEKDGLIYLAEYKGLDSSAFKSMPETFWFNHH